MKKVIKIFFRIAGVLLLIIILSLVYLNLVYLPQKVRSEGPALLKQKTKGQVQAESIQYIPFRGVKLENITFLSKDKKTILRVEKLYLNVSLLPLILRHNLEFRLDLYPSRKEKPFTFRGLYQIKEQKLDLDFKIRNDFFTRSQAILGKLNISLNNQEKIDMELRLNSTDLNILSNLYIEDKDLHIEKFAGTILGSGFNFIGDVQNLNRPFLNIYGNLEVNLAGLKGINPKYLKLPKEVDLEGYLSGKVFISSKPGNPQIGLKMNSSGIKIKGITLEDLLIISELKNKKLSLSKFYARLCEGEMNLQGALSLDSKDLPAHLNINVFNLDMHKAIKEATGKDSPVHGRLFSLGRFAGSLKDPKSVEGKMWLSSSGSNILQLPLFEGISDALRLPQMRKIEFKEASGNFSIAKQQVRTNDFKITSDNVTIYFKGYIDFAGDLAFDVHPTFSQNFLAVPNIGNILGVFTDTTTGSFLGEIKLKGNIKNPRYTFKPISIEKLIPRGIEEGLKQLFKLKKKE